MQTTALCCAADGIGPVRETCAWPRCLEATGARTLAGPLGVRFTAPGYDTFRRLLG